MIFFMSNMSIYDHFLLFFKFWSNFILKFLNFQICFFQAYQNTIFIFDFWFENTAFIQTTTLCVVISLHFTVMNIHIINFCVWGLYCSNWFLDLTLLKTKFSPFLFNFLIKVNHHLTPFHSHSKKNPVILNGFDLWCCPRY